EKVLLKLKDIYGIDKRVKQVENNLVKLIKLLNLKNKRDKINKSLSIGKVYIEEFSKLDSIFHIEDSLELKINLLKKLTNYKTNYNHINKSKQQVKVALDDTNIQKSKLLKKYKFMLTKIEICPICFGNIDRLKIDEIINSYE